MVNHTYIIDFIIWAGPLLIKKHSVLKNHVNFAG